MSGDGLTVEMLPARHGDALWIEWGEPSDRHRMLVDGGPSATYEMLRDRFSELAPDDRRVDLLVITHVDLDHIDGAIRLVRDASLGIEFGDVWFNDFRHLGEGEPERGALQGEFLAATIEHRGLRWNEAFAGRAVQVLPTGSLPSVRLPGGLRVVLLSPTPDTLLSLRGKWESTLQDAEMEPGDRAEALARLEERLGPAERGGRVRFGGDRSAANGSSIAFVAEYGDERWLLAGDAFAEVLVAGLDRYGREHGGTPVRLDGFKLPHHGSVRNVTPELLAAIDCRRFLVSTNGAYFQHPDEACIDLLVADADHPELVFNYRTSFTSKWAEPSPDYRAVYLDDQDATVTAGHHPDDAPATEEPPADASPDDAPATEEPPAGPAIVPAGGDRRPVDVAESSAGAAADRDGGGAGVPAIRVDVVHGSLDLADHPVLVGHYRATALSGTEQFVDRRFGGRLSQRFAVGEYPGDVGTALSVRPPRLRHPACGVIVVGLGEYGELTPLRLMETIRIALVRHALDELDARREADAGDVATLGISGVLVGATGEEGLSVTSSVRALTMAVREANRSLAAGGRPRVAYDRLQLWEQYESRAELAFRAAREVGVELSGGPTSGDQSVIVPCDDLRRSAGALENSPVVDATDRVWRRLRIAEHAGTEATPDRSPCLELEIAVSGQLARTGRVVHQVERRRLERLLTGVVGESRPGAGIHTALFELLLPNELKWQLMAAQDIQLEVDDATADIPWEMLAARDTEQGARSQLALRAPIVRQLGLANIPTVRRSRRPTALVIGNPPGGRRFPTLPGAYGEARTVQLVLERPQFSYEVTSLCYDGDDRDAATVTTEIETALFANDFRVIHIAGHGLFQPDDPTRTGVVIGPDDFLTAQTFKQLNVVPDVVFLNCCHLAAIAPGMESGAIEFTHRRLNQLGASLARQLIDSGVRAVVVAGWAVEDRAALSFARTFYEEMLDGSTFGEAVYQARRAAWRTSPEHSTWGAYQCYGDGGYRLPRDPGRSAATRSIPPPLTVMESIRRIQHLLRRIEFMGAEGASDGAEHTRDELELIEATARERRWVDGGGPVPASLAQRLREALAEARGAIGDQEEAVGWYRAGLAAEESTMSLRAVEQLANHQDRLARQLGRRADGTEDERARIGELLTDSMRLIELLEQLSGSGERAALRAGHHKRRAAATSGAERIEAVRLAADAYLSAYEHNGKHYGLLNHIQLEELRARLDGDESSARRFDGELASCETSVPDQGDFWSIAATADARLTRAIVDDAVDRRVDELVACYTDAFEARSTALQRASMLDHLRDLADLHPHEAQAAALARIHEVLCGPGTGA